MAAPPRENLLLALIPPFRWVFFSIVALLIVLSFNGQWRVGRDSAAYRGLGHHLATTGKYVFRDKDSALAARYSDQQDTRYPGLPLVLAGVEKAFGRGDRPAVLVSVVSAVLTLVLTYRLVRPLLPAWLTVAVVFGMGTNGRFLTHSNEILADVPFLLGVVGALLAFDRLQTARTGGRRAAMLSLLVVALIFAAAMRPTFWVFALALVGTCLWGLVRPVRSDGSADAASAGDDPTARRVACGATLAVLAVAALVFVLVVDVRGRGAAGYEGKLAARLDDFQHRVIGQLPENVHGVLEQTLPEFFFGTQLGPGFVPLGGGRWAGLSTVFSILLIVCAVRLTRRNVVWGLFAVLTIVTMAVIGSVPRYFVMILPLLLAAWGLGVARFAERFARFPGAREAIAFFGLGLVVAPNLLACANLVREQRGLGRPEEGFKKVGFMAAYHAGEWNGVHAVGKMIRDHVRPDQRVIGPEATVLTYLSDRQVFGLSLFLPRRDRDGRWDRLLRQNKSKFAYCVFPDAQRRLYDDKDIVTGKLIERGVLRPTKTVATAAGYKLCEFEVVEVPKKAKRKGTKDPIAATQPRRGGTKDPVAATQPKRKGTKDPVAATQPKRKGTKDRIAATQPKRRARPASGPVMSPATQGAGATQPAAPRRRRRPAATTAPLPATRPTAVPAQPGALLDRASPGHSKTWVTEVTMPLWVFDRDGRVVAASTVMRRAGSGHDGTDQGGDQGDRRGRGGRGQADPPAEPRARREVGAEHAPACGREQPRRGDADPGGGRD